MANILQEIESATASANNLWSGTNYLVISTSDLGLLASASISQVVYGKSNIDYINTSDLSSRSHMVPVKYRPGTITFRGATFRDTTLYERFFIQQQYLKGGGALKPENIIIYTYGVGGVQQAVPISIIVAVGCNPISYIPANADANGTDIPLEELIIQPHDLFRVASDGSTIKGLIRDIF